MSVMCVAGENPAAMQTGGGGIAEHALWLTALLLLAGVHSALG